MTFKSIFKNIFIREKEQPIQEKEQPIQEKEQHISKYDIFSDSVLGELFKNKSPHADSKIWQKESPESYKKAQILAKDLFHSTILKTYRNGWQNIEYRDETLGIICQSFYNYFLIRIWDIKTKTEVFNAELGRGEYGYGNNHVNIYRKGSWIEQLDRLFIQPIKDAQIKQDKQSEINTLHAISPLREITINKNEALNINNVDK